MNANRSSTIITTASALVLALGGGALLFGSDALLPRVVPALPATAAVLGPLVAAGWLAIAWLNWSQRGVIVGGIYARPMVLANLALYLVSAFSLARPAMHVGASPVLGAFVAVFGMLALLYATLLLRGPFGSDARGA